MTRQTRTLVVDDRGLAELLEPRDGIVGECVEASGRFALAEGPFSIYSRVVDHEPVDGQSGSHHVTESFEWKLAVPVFWILYYLPVRHHLGSGSRTASPWWAPTGRLDARAANVIGLLGVLAVVNGYLGTVIGQTLTFAADEFCDSFSTVDGITTCTDPKADKSARADIFSITRIAIVLSLVLAAAGDRFGRRRAITIAVTASCTATALGALSPGLWAVTASQTVARGLATGLSILIVVVASEELPPKSRAYGVSMIALLAGLGSGMVIWVLPLADVAVWGWRFVYGVAFVFIPFALWAGRRLPESRRFLESTSLSTADALRRFAASTTLRRRILLLGTGALALTVFATPASQFANQYLRDELGFSASRISLFTVVTSTPVGIGVLAGGALADRLGRRPVAAIGLLIGTIMTLGSFFLGGAPLWGVRLVGVVLGSGLALPALAVYGPELFPTRLRSSANAIIVLFGVIGSVVGLQLVGRLSERWGSFGPALAVSAVGPVLLIVLIITRYPETASMTLEEINPDDETGQLN